MATRTARNVEALGMIITRVTVIPSDLCDDVRVYVRIDRA